MCGLIILSEKDLETIRQNHKFKTDEPSKEDTPKT